LTQAGKICMSSVGLNDAEVKKNGTAPYSLPFALRLGTAPDPFRFFERLSGLSHVLFLDSALRHPNLGRYSYITADPIDWIRVSVSDGVVSHEDGPQGGPQGSDHSPSTAPPLTRNSDPFRLLQEKLAKFGQTRRSDLPPFQGGAAGLLGYGLSSCLEKLPQPKRDEFRVPDLAVGIYDWLIAIDHFKEEAWIISTGYPEQALDRRRRRAGKRVRQVQDWLEQGTGNGGVESRGWVRKACTDLPTHHSSLHHPAKASSNFSRKTYLETVDRAIEYIRAGDCFQINLAQRLLYPAQMAPLELYRRLRERNPATFAGYFDLGDFVIASSSPERFLQVIDGEVEARPIKGTRSRGTTAEEEQASAEQLLSSPKDRAENIMIVDLLRNDLGRVCRYGSVRVPAVCELETYGFVHHLVSQVRGHLRQGIGPIDLLKASFPGGSVTGAPKIRAMEIIAELEPDARGPYCGCLGYIGFDGAMDTNILIRTFTYGSGWLQFPVGGGIVADSIPEREYDETWLKAEGMLRALEEAG
jgi:para-aminobenzoate synthetase component I